MDAADHRRRLNLTLRYLGIILPIVASYAGLILADGHPLGLWLGLGIGAVLWSAFTIVLLARRDWAGAGTVTFCYVVLSAWVWLLITGVMPG